jgi:cell division protein FtsZ
MQQPSQAQPRATEEEGRESFWRGLFPQRQRSEAAFTPIGSAQPSQASAEPADDGGDRYVPGSARTALNPASRPDAAPSSEAEDDLEIPSFLRRLAN